MNIELRNKNSKKNKKIRGNCMKLITKMHQLLIMGNGRQKEEFEISKKDLQEKMININKNLFENLEDIYCEVDLIVEYAIYLQDLKFCVGDIMKKTNDYLEMRENMEKMQEIFIFEQEDFFELMKGNNVFYFLEANKIGLINRDDGFHLLYNQNQFQFGINNFEPFETMEKAVLFINDNI